MERKLYLTLNKDGRWAETGAYTSKSSRTLRFDISLEERAVRDYETLEDTTALCFSLCASPCKSGVSHQCFDDLYKKYLHRVPEEKRGDFCRLYSIWGKYHLNDLTCGTKAQEDAIGRQDAKIETFDERCVFLRQIGLYDDRGYRYGSGWLCRQMPKEDIDFINRLCTEWGK